MDIPFTPNVLQTQTHGVLCTVSSPAATSSRLPGAPSDSAKHWEWELGKAETQPSPQSKHSTDICMRKVQVATNSMVAW